LKLVTEEIYRIEISQCYKQELSDFFLDSIPLPQSISYAQPEKLSCASQRAMGYLLEGSALAPAQLLAVVIEKPEEVPVTEARLGDRFDYPELRL
jgi:hypothetical protein